MSHKIKTCFALSVAIAAICIPRAQAGDPATPDSPYRALSRGVEDRRTGQILKLAALKSADDDEKRRFQFVLINGDDSAPIGQVMEGHPWNRIKDEIGAKYGEMPLHGGAFFPKVIAIPGMGLLITWASVTDGDLGPHWGGELTPWGRIAAFPLGLGIFVVGIPVGAAIDLFELGTTVPRPLAYAVRNGNLVRAFLNVMDFSQKGKKPAKAGHRAFTRLLHIVSGDTRNPVTIDSSTSSPSRRVF